MHLSEAGQGKDILNAWPHDGEHPSLSVVGKQDTIGLDQRPNVPWGGGGPKPGQTQSP
jgi:hypothetical protein